MCNLTSAYNQPSCEVQAILRSIAKVRFETGKTPTVIRQFLVDQLRYNDNTTNPVCSAYNTREMCTHHTIQYADALYISTVISALGHAIVSAVPPERGEFISSDNGPSQDSQDAELLKLALSEVDRYRSMDRLIPTFHNVVTVAVIEVSAVQTHFELPLTPYSSTCSSLLRALFHTTPACSSRSLGTYACAAS